MAVESSDQESKASGDGREASAVDARASKRPPSSSPASGKDAREGKAKKKPGANPEAKGEGDDPDALMAATLRAMDWAGKRRTQLLYLLGGLAVVGAAIGGFTLYRSDRELKASALLTKGMDAEVAPLKKGDETPQILKLATFYATEDDKQKAAIAAYVEAKSKYGDTGAGILARLGEAGVHLDRREWDDAIAGYTDVAASSLAKADVNVRLRCIEGLGYAREGKGDLDGARRNFDELSNVDMKGAKSLGLYHLARLDAGKGTKDGNDAAINKLKAAREELMKSAAPSTKFLRESIEKLLGKLDPSAVPKSSTQGFPGMPGMGGLGKGGGKITQEQIEQIMRQQGGGMPKGTP